MIKGHFYQHDAAKDSFIKVLSLFRTKPGELKVKCKIYTHLSPVPWQTMTFRLPMYKMKFWKPITPTNVIDN